MPKMTLWKMKLTLELNELKQLVEGRGPSSVLDLHLNIVRILDSTGRVPGRAREESPVQVGAALLNYMNKMTRILALSLYTMLHCTYVHVIFQCVNSHR